jgi:GntR family transcriptional regulator
LTSIVALYYRSDTVMAVALRLRVDARSPIPIRWQLSEQLKHVIEAGGVPRDQALPSIRELAGFLGINPNTVARAIEDLKRSGHVEARRGKGVFVAAASRPAPSLTQRDGFLKETVIRAAALGMTPDDVAVGVLSLADLGVAALRGAAQVLLVECSAPELDFFTRELQAQLPVRVAKVLLEDLATTVRRQGRSGHWAAAVTSFGHLPEVERQLKGLGVPVLALLAEAHLETLQRLAQLPRGARVGVIAAAVETTHTVQHSIAAAALPNITRIETCPAEGPALKRLVRRVSVVVCSSATAKRVQGLVDPAVPVIIDDRALNQRAIQMLGAVLAQHDGDHLTATSLLVREPPGRRPSGAVSRPLHRLGQRRSGRGTVRGSNGSARDLSHGTRGQSGRRPARRAGPDRFIRSLDRHLGRSPA